MLRYSKVLWPRGGGAESNWFGSEKSSDTVAGCLKSFVVCLIGLGIINFVFRGNVLGYCGTKDQVVLPFTRSTLPSVRIYGFVDLEDNKEQQQQQQVEEREKK